MPNVSGKKFAYTKSGMKKAKAFAKKTGKKIIRAKPKKRQSGMYR
tara:strand:- start:232 stop:366 length:135 start_codon:yes stop_codon:yes gene_type:complete